MSLTDQACDRLAREAAVWVTVVATEGSTPRDATTWMAVFADATVGTIGGGQVELQATREARRRLGGAPGDPVLRYALGPSLGQCCGGVMRLRFERMGRADAPALRARLAPQLTPVALFGAGNVGQALVEVLARLPFAVHWIDSRDQVFPQQLPANVNGEHSDPVQRAVATLAPQSQVLIMSFSHAEDLDVVAACLARLRARDDLPYVGLIGSRTKWASFGHRLRQRGFSATELARVTCPIGVSAIAGKDPAVIAVAVAAQLLQQRPAPRNC